MGNIASTEPERTISTGSEGAPPIFAFGAGATNSNQGDSTSNSSSHLGDSSVGGVTPPVQRFSSHDGFLRQSPSSAQDGKESPLQFNSTESSTFLVGDEAVVSLDGRDTVPTVFKWEHGGRKVYITGTFNNWKDSDERWEMHRSRNDFTFITDLPRGKHMYKFIVDGEWRFAPDQDTFADAQGTIQNVVDLTNFRQEMLDQKNAFGDSIPDDDEAYGQHIPALHEYTKEPSLLPPHMRHIILNQHLADKPPQAMPIPQHVTLNHLYCTAMKGGLVVLSTTQRYREKFVTTVSYMVQDEEFSRIMTQINQIKSTRLKQHQLLSQSQQKNGVEEPKQREQQRQEQGQ